jgi:uncharacterized protein YbbK (DUF523 family)
MAAKIKLGISSCLLGEKVRYDGGHKLDRFLTKTLGKYVDWIPVCPEVECGLPILRESMRLVGNPENPRLVTLRSGQDYTERMLLWAEVRLNQFEKLDLCGYIFKSRSPSCGLRRIRITSLEDYSIHRMGTGVWARTILKRFPDLPVVDERQLHDLKKRLDFMKRVRSLAPRRAGNLLPTNEAIRWAQKTCPPYKKKGVK